MNVWRVAHSSRVSLAVGGRRAAGHVDYLELVDGRVELEENAPLPDAPAVGLVSLETHDVAGEGIMGHGLKYGEESFAIVLRCATDYFSRGLWEDDLPDTPGRHLA